MDRGDAGAHSFCRRNDIDDEGQAAVRGALSHIQDLSLYFSW